MPKTFPDQRKPFAKSQEPRPVPLPARNNSFPYFNSPFRFFTEATNLQETQRNLARRRTRHAGCSVHSSFPLHEEEKMKVGKRKGNSDEEDGKSKNKISKESIPSFSSPWGPSFAHPRGCYGKKLRIIIVSGNESGSLDGRGLSIFGRRRGLRLFVRRGPIALMLVIS